MRSHSLVRSSDKLTIKALDRRGKCKWCGSDRVVRNGRSKGQQLYRCNDCRHQFFDNGKFPRMRKPKKAVAFALEMYFSGESLPKVATNLRKFLSVYVHPRKILEWIQKYAPMVDDFTSQFQPQLCGIYHADETAIKFRPRTPLTQEERAKRVRRKGEQYWHFDAIDEKTRFLVSLHVSKDRGIEDTVAFFKDCAYNTPRPQAIITDDMNAYPRAFNKMFWSCYLDRKVRHLHTHGFGARMNNQPIERWHSTLKDRLKPMRGLVSPDTQVLRGFAIHYNFIRPHSSLHGSTPAKAAQIDLPFEDGWGDLIGWATKWQTMKKEN